MKSNSRHIILEKIACHSEKNALDSFLPIHNQIFYKPIKNSLETCFKRELERVGGCCYIFSTEDDLFAGISEFLEDRKLTKIFSSNAYFQKFIPTVTSCPENFETMEVAVTECECLVARTGSVLVSSANLGGRQLQVYPPIHVVIASRSQIYPYITDALQFVNEKYKGLLPSLLSIVTGQSRTADIEKTLVMGAHGPRELHLFIA